MYIKISSETSQKIKNMSLLCAFLVVSIHVEWTHSHSITAGWLMYHAIKQGVARIAVPFFFVVSGFFLAQHFDEECWWGREVKKRVMSLVLPFLLWSTISLVGTTPLSIIADLIAHRPFGTSIFFLHNANWLRLYGLDLTDYPLHVPLWYVRCLFLFVLTGYLFKIGVGRFKYLWIAFAFSFHLLGNHLPVENLREFFRVGYSTAGIFYFSVGVAIQRFRLKNVSRQGAIACGVVGLSLLAVKMVLAFNALRFEIFVGKLLLPFLIYFIWHFMPAKKLPNWLTMCSFPIFLMHTVLFGYIGILLKHLHVDGLVSDFTMYLGGVLGSMIIACALRYFTPKVAAILFGGR